MYNVFIVIILLSLIWFWLFVIFEGIKQNKNSKRKNSENEMAVLGHQARHFYHVMWMGFLTSLIFEQKDQEYSS